MTIDLRYYRRLEKLPVTRKSQLAFNVLLFFHKIFYRMLCILSPLTFEILINLLFSYRVRYVLVNYPVAIRVPVHYLAKWYSFCHLTCRCTSIVIDNVQLSKVKIAFNRQIMKEIAKQINV